VWTSWREGLPDGAPLRAASLERLAFQASSLDPEPERARHIRRLALDLAQGLFAAGLGDVWGDARALQALAASALLQDAGRTRKAAAKRILEIPPPPGWTAADMERTALVARYRRGAEPEPDRDDLASLDEADRRIVASLAAVLRLADALDPGAEARVLRVDVEVGPEVVHVLASGYQDDARAAARIARAKHLLEKVTGRVFVVRGHPIRPRLVSPAQPSFRRTPTG
jgi:exopolyphosphatase/pppGpp-phosphohydrolase